MTATVAGVVLAAGAGSRFRDADPGAASHKLRADFRGRPVVSWVLDTVLEVGFNQVFVITGAVDLADLLPPGVTERQLQDVIYPLPPLYSTGIKISPQRVVGVS